MTPKKVFFIMLGVLVLIIGAGIGSLVIGNSILEKQSSQLVDLKLNTQLLDEQQLALQTAKKDIQKYSDLETIAKTVVPQDKDQAEVVREIIDLASKSGIKIGSITFPSSTLGATTTAPGATPTTVNAITQAIPVSGIPGVLALSINITPDSTQPVTYYQFLDFLQRLENNRRTAQVDDIKITPTTTDNKNPDITFALTINTFIKP